MSLVPKDWCGLEPIIDNFCKVKTKQNLDYVRILNI